MAESEIDYIRYAGRVVFPRNPPDLTSTANCPACLSPLAGTVCATCKLDLNHPAAWELHQLSVDAAGLLEARLAIIGRMRYETDQLLAHRAVQTQAQVQASTVTAAAGPPTAWPQPAPVAAGTADATAAQRAAIPPTVTPPVVAPPTVALSAGPAQQQTQHAPRRSSVQIILLLVGVALLSIAAIFFLVYAFINYGLTWRTIIIGAITAAAIYGASRLRQRGLTATAEGIAAFAVVLVYLDAFALRANNLFDLASGDGVIYWGIALVVSSIGFIIWHRVSSLRVPNIAGLAAFAPGVGLIVGGASDRAATSTSVFLAFAAVAAAGLIHLAAAPRAAASGTATAERAIVLGTTSFALIAAFFIGFIVDPTSDWTPTFALAALVVIALVHVGVLVRVAGGDRLQRAFGGIFSGFAGTAAAAAVGISAIRVSDTNFIVIAPLVAATIVALLGEALARHLAEGVAGSYATVAARSAAAVTGIVLLVPAGIAAVTTVLTAARGLTETWQHDGTDAVADLDPMFGWAVLAILTAGALAAAAWWAMGIVRSRGPVLAWLAAAVAVPAVAQLTELWLILAAWLVLAVAALIALMVVRRQARIDHAYRAALIGTVIAAGTLGYAVSWASTSTWWIGSLIVIVLLLAARTVAASTEGRAGLLGAAIVVLLIAAAAAAQHVTFSAPLPAVVETMNAVRVVGLAAAILLAFSAVAFRRAVSIMDRRVTFWLSAVVAGTSVASVSWSLTSLNPSSIAALLLPEFWTSLFVGLLLFAGLLLWVGLRSTATLRPERILASIALAPTIYLVVIALTRLLHLPEFAGPVAAVTATLLASAGAVTVAVLRPSTSPRWSRELSAALVGVPAVGTALMGDNGQTWLVLILAALTAFFLGVSADGLFSSVSRRRHLGWLALALAAGGLWWRLAGDEVALLEPYVLPLAVALLIVAFFIWRATSRSKDAEPSRAAPLIVLGGLLVAILPLAVNAATGSLVRAIVVSAVSAAMLLLGSLVLGSPRIRPYLDAAALAGAIGVIVTAGGRAVLLATTPGSTADARLDSWLAGAFLVLVVAAFGQMRPRGDATKQPRALAGQALGIMTMAAVLVPELLSLQVDGLGPIRALALVLLFAALHILARALDQAPFTRAIGWVAITFSGIAAIVGIAVDALDRVELGTVPIAAALLVTGTMHLAAVPTARSWPWLGPGTAILLAPSLLATIDDRPLWRLVGLGIVGVAVVAIGVIRRLQAPFVIGVVVVLIHGVATFLPQIRAVYEFAPWWLWLGAGGVLLIVLAARYERRIRDLKNVAMKLAALR